MFKKTTLLFSLLFQIVGFTYAQVNTMPMNLPLPAKGKLSTISGEISGFKDAYFILNYEFFGDNYKSDTVFVTEDKFKWSGKISETQKGLISFSNATVPIFLEAGNTRIEGRGDSLFKVKITGTKIQEDVERYKKFIRATSREIDTLYATIDKISDTEKPALKEQLQALKEKKSEIEDQFIAENPNSAVSLSLVSSKSLDSYAACKKGFDLLGKSIRNSLSGKNLSRRMVILKRSQLGEKIPDFQQNNPDGKPIKLSDFKGKYVFIDFWASWCGPCRAENPNLLKAYNQFKGNNFTVIGVSLDDKVELWKKAISEDGMPWAQISDLKGWKNVLSSYYGIESIPSSILIGPDGRVIAKDLRGEDLHHKLSELFEQSK